MDMTGTREKIALVTESSAELPKDIIEKYEIHTVPLRVIYNDGEYRDGIDITPQEVYDRFEREIPKTSMPAATDVMSLFDSLREKGYRKILCIHLSCNLSGTVDMVRMVAKEYEDLEIEIIDTKSVSIGSGIIVYHAARLIEQGHSLQEIKQILSDEREKSKVFFCIPMLDYLRKGGRIGLVAATLGTLMDLKPIISVNQEGRYYSHAKVRGRKKSLEKLVEITTDFIRDNKVIVALYQGAAQEEANEIEKIFRKMPNIQELLTGQISPSMVVHTGPGLVGIAIQQL